MKNMRTMSISKCDICNKEFTNPNSVTILDTKVTPKGVVHACNDCNNYIIDFRERQKKQFELMLQEKTKQFIFTIKKKYKGKKNVQSNKS